MVGGSVAHWVGLVVVLVVVGMAWGAIPPLGKEELKQSATHIVVGEVKRVYTSEKAGDRAGFTDRVYAIEVAPSAIEKGEGLKEGRLIYARAWTPDKRPFGWVGGQGQNIIPEAGKRVRMYLREGKDGGLDLVEPNGVEVVK
jgi:hypothetical protein